MAVYYKFKSERDFYSMPICGISISVGKLKDKIFASNRYGRGNDFDLAMTNAQTNEEYVDESALIPNHTSVLIRRIPRWSGKTIVCEPDKPKVEMETKVEDLPMPTSTISEKPEWNDFGNDVYTIPRLGYTHSSNPVLHVNALNKDVEEKKIKALDETSALDWQCKIQHGYGSQRGFAKGMARRMMVGCGFGQGGLPHKTPPEGYVCHRCNVPGHFIQYCPTNGDHNYDFKRVKPLTGIPKSMLVANPDGSYVLPTGAVAVLKPNEAIFEKEAECIPSIRAVSDIPPELHCPLCKDVMKDAMVTSKCCFNSFCDGCIRGYTISKGRCVCGATDILADDLIPNKTLRETIHHFLESLSSSSGNIGSSVHVHDTGSAGLEWQKTASSTVTYAYTDDCEQPCADSFSNLKKGEGGSDGIADNVVVHTLEKNDLKNIEAKLVLANVKEHTSQENAEAFEGAQEKQFGSGEQGEKKKKKRMHLPESAAEMQWSYAAIPLAPSAYDPYMASCAVPWGIGGYVGKFMPYMGYMPVSLDVSSWGVSPQDPYGEQTYMLPIHPGDITELGIWDGTNQGPSMSTMKGFKAKTSNVTGEHEKEQLNERGQFKDMDMKVGSNDDVSLVKLKHKAASSVGTAERVDLDERFIELEKTRHSPRGSCNDPADHSPLRTACKKRKTNQIQIAPGRSSWRRRQS